jgi:hypothetical protein
LLHTIVEVYQTRVKSQPKSELKPDLAKEKQLLKPPSRKSVIFNLEPAEDDPVLDEKSNKSKPRRSRSKEQQLNIVQREKQAKSRFVNSL